MATLTNTTINSTETVKIPVGTTAQRPASPTNGMMRYNTTLSTVEIYINGVWTSMRLLAV
jgi:hypothetical protein